jgi:sulfoxide reductase catalytic subunit YedY
VNQIDGDFDMLIKLPRPWDMRSSDITDESIYVNRRSFIKTGVGLAGAALAATAPLAEAGSAQNTLAAKKGPFSTSEPLNSFEDVTGYNNFYEFGLDKADPARHAGKMTVKPWSVKIDGLCNKPGELPLEDLLRPHALEERTYRLRCVEAWSMVVPWVGFPVADLLKRFEPKPEAKFVTFTTAVKTTEMPGVREAYLAWPYREALRIDEAMNPLTFMAVGLYGKTLPNQNGAPMRLVVPWKYGFKSAKSIVRISFHDKQPNTAWNEANPREYGFFSNVNPEVSHPRWSQARERRIGEFFRRPTMMFNGYGEQVASLYAGMDLKKYY